MHPTEPADSGQDPSEKVDLDAIRRRCDAATPGPWGAGTDWSHWAIGQVGPGGGWVRRVVETANQNNSRSFAGADLYGISERDDAEFIANARQDIPALLAEVARLRAERDRLIDGHISASGPVARHVRYTVFPDSIAERKFDTREQARAHVRRMLGLEVES